MSGTTQALFPVAVTDAGCLSYPQPSTTRAWAPARARVATPLVAPGAPTGLSASVAGSTVTLTWLAPSVGDAPTSYLLEAGSVSGRSDLASTDTGSPTPSLTATNVPPGTYFVRVRARNAGGTSVPSNEVAVTVQGACANAPGAPSGLTATVSGSSLTLTWLAPVGGCTPTMYVLEAGSGPGLANLASFSTGSTSTTFSTSGVGGGTYYVRVRAGNAAGYSSPSNEVSFTMATITCASAPGAPTGLTATVSGATVSLGWTAPAAGCAPTTYFIEAGSASGLSDLVSTSSGSALPNFSFTGVPNGKYYARVRSVNAVGQSDVSNEVQFTLGGVTPTTVAWVVEGVRLTNATTGFSGGFGDTSTIRLNDGRWRMFLVGNGAYHSAVSSDGLTFTMEPGTRLPLGNGQARVLRLDDGRVRIYYRSGGGILSAISTDEGLAFTAEAGERISASATGLAAVSSPSFARGRDGRWHMYFSDLAATGTNLNPLRIFSASSSDLLTWTLDPGVRIGAGAVLGGSAEHPSAFTNADGSITLIYFPKTPTGLMTSTSPDGLTFTTETSIGIPLGNDPDVVRLPDGMYRMYYNWGDDTSGTIYSAKGTVTSR